MRIGLIAMSAKPFHAGHGAIIRLAARECDEVHLYVSTSDRARPGEVVILGADMARLWKETIESTMPANVNVVYGGSPIGNIWKELGHANEVGSQDDYVLYSDPIDVEQNFQARFLEKYCGRLYETGHVRLRPVDRSSTVEVSGTRMREFLAAGDKENFTKFLPQGVDKDLVWDVLRKSASSLPSEKKVTGSKKKPVSKKSGS